MLQLNVKNKDQTKVQLTSTLEFDGAGHEIHSAQVKAWVARHPNSINQKG